MKKYLLILITLFNATLICGHTAETKVEPMRAVNDTIPSIPANMNYVLTRTMLSGDNEEYLDAIQFYDGLGRESEQTLSDGSNALGYKYRHFLQEYDSLGRVEKKWLPTTSKFTFLQPELYKKVIDVPHFMDEKRPFSQIIYEPSSPSDRPSHQYASGDAWKDHPRKMEYMANMSSDSLRCSFYYISMYNYLARQDDYLPGELNVSKIADEDGKTTYTFQNKEGHTVLTRQMNGEEMADTYYVYDNMGRLRFVLPPMINDDISLNNLELYAYEYRYDTYGRCNSKKLPGCPAVKYVYDKTDRVILSQDGVQALKDEWTFTFYDNIGRVTLKGLCNITVRPALDNVTVKSYRTSTENGGDLESGYKVENFPYPLSSLLQAYYYDDYYFTSDTKLAYDYNSDYNFRYINTAFGNISERGLLTGMKMKALDTNLYLSSAFYYDEKGRIIQRRSQNHKGGYDVEYYSYTFSGKLSAKRCTYQVKNGKQQGEEYKYRYNELDDLSDINHKLDGAVLSKRVVDYRYDSNNRIQFKDLGRAGYYTRYVYDIHDQITEAISTLFTQQLFYNNGIGKPCYNGNISSMTWKSEGDANTRGYCFDYDGLNRFTKAEYGEKEDMSLNRGRYDEQVTSYDKNGNIRALKRCGQTEENAYGLVDSLSLSYTGNRLLSVADHATDTAYNDGFEFKEGERLATEYLYDANGNLTQDLNKKISDIQYNCLNLPDTIKFVDGSSVTYLYRADGKKLQVTHKNGNSINVTDYCGNAIYENGNLEKILLDGEGYVSFSAPDPIYYYFIKDVLGNVRAVFDQNRELKEINHYYPFGGLMASSSASIQDYKYNGKELDRKNGLDWYDYGARHYDPAIGRWNAVDPMAEKYYGLSLYSYCNNNPVNLIDPTGNVFTRYQDQYGNLLANTNDGSQNVVTVPNNRTDEFKKHLLFTSDYLQSSQGWNDYWADEFKGTEAFKPTPEQQAVLDMQHSDWARKNGIEYWKEPNLWNWVKYVGSEVLSQYTDPELVAGGLSAGIMGMNKPTVQNSEYTFTKSAGKHMSEFVKKGMYKGELSRPYMNWSLPVNEIMATGKGVPDATFKGGMNWRAPGYFRNQQGIWELGINPKTKVIYHFNFTN